RAGGEEGEGRKGPDRWVFEVTLTEGRKREVRRLCKALGLYVHRLRRTQFGPIRLHDLPPGASRELSARERSAIEKLTSGMGSGRLD
ncbi:MAG: hypothetical protein ACREOG_13425, partial [Gemmatimonadaceae bacterium]